MRPIVRGGRGDRASLGRRSAPRGVRAAVRWLLPLAALAVGALAGCRTSATVQAPEPDVPASATIAGADGPSPAAAIRAVPPPPASSGWETIGRSVEGRPVEALTIGRGPRRALLIGGIHGDEDEGLGALGAVLDDLRSDPSIGRAWTVRVWRDLNPDGSAAGTRRNARGVDLNRNWPASNFRPGRARGPAPMSEPEIAAACADLDRFGPELVIVFHAARGGPFVNHDPPHGAAPAAAAVFAGAASRSGGRTWGVVADMGYPTPGSLGSYAGLDLGLPVLTVEFRRGQDAASADRAARAGVAAVMGGDPPVGPFPGAPSPSRAGDAALGSE